MGMIDPKALEFCFFFKRLSADKKKMLCDNRYLNLTAINNFYQLMRHADYILIFYFLSKLDSLTLKILFKYAFNILIQKCNFDKNFKYEISRIFFLKYSIYF